MRRWCVGFILLALAGCQSTRYGGSEDMLAPVRMRMHPVFTQIKNLEGGQTPDGIQAELEFQDQFGDAAKAAGNAMFQLYEYRPYDPDPRGDRVVNPWIASLWTVDDQRLRWNRTTSTYTFDLKCPGIDVHKGYVLEATFQGTGGRRFFSRLIFQAQELPRGRRRPISPLSAPATRP